MLKPNSIGKTSAILFTAALAQDDPSCRPTNQPISQPLLKNPPKIRTRLSDSP